VSNAIGSLSSRTNTVAPGMLAILQSAGSPFIDMTGFIYASLLPVQSPPPVITNVLIRPSGSTTTLSVNIVSTVSGTATFIVPSGIPFGAAEVLWQTNGVYQATNVYVVRNNFELAQAGTGGPAKAQILSAAGTLTDVGMAAPARPGQTVQLSGSGLGYGTQVTASIGGFPATVVYAGRNGSRPGYDQIQLQIPAGAGDGCFVPLSLTVDSAVVNSSLSVTSDGSACQHPFQFSASDLKTLDQGGSIATGQINMETDLQAALDTAASWSEQAYFSSAEWNAAAFPTPNISVPASCTDVTPGTLLGAVLGAVRVGDFSQPPAQLPPLPDPGKSVALQNGGTILNLSGSGGFYATTFPVTQENSLANLPPAVLMPGKWTFSTPGSADLAASSFTFSVPVPIRLSGGAPVALRRDQDQAIQWNGAGLDSTSKVNLSLTGRSADGTTPRTVFCSASAKAGSITIPSALISPFAPASIGSIRVQTAPSIESLPHMLVKTKKGDTLLLFVQYGSSDSRPVDFR
jgi:uncharacterized protein (TIGR03437 family)